MEIYDQHEQSERVRSWLQENASAIITGVVIGLAAIFGYHQWQGHQLNQAHAAAELYERTRQADPAKPAPESDAARSQLRSEYASSGYASLAALAQAQAQLQAKDLDGARATLTWVRDSADEPALATLAGLRLARLDLAGSKPEDALKTLDALPKDGYGAERAELRGDVLVALGRAADARAAYLEAQTAGAADPARLEMKLGELATDEGEGA